MHEDLCMGDPGKRRTLRVVRNKKDARPEDTARRTGLRFNGTLRHDASAGEQVKKWSLRFVTLVLLRSFGHE
jgi:hypothetical protein